MRLADLEREALLEDVAEEKAVQEARVDARHAHHAAAAHGRNALARRLAAAGLHFQLGEHGFDRTALGLEAHRVDDSVDAAEVRGLDDHLGSVDLVEVDRHSTVEFPGSGCNPTSRPQDL